MKRLMLDHYRRWRWVLLPGAVYALVLGWAVALPADYGASWHGKHLHPLVWLKVQGSMFAMQTFILATWMGAILLAFDLQHGLVRTVRALPLTAKQIGQAWWLATAGLPAIASIVLLSLGAGAFCLFHPGDPFPVGRMVLTCVFTVLWFGTGFTVYLNKSTGPGWGGNWRAILLNLGVTALLIWMTFGFALSLGAANNPVKCGVFLASGALLTAVGWRRACQFSPGSVRPFLPQRAASVLTPLASADTCGLARASHGVGAIRFLMQSTFARIFFMLITVIIYAGLIFRLEGLVTSWDDTVRFMGAMALPFWVIIFLQITPVLKHLRLLRTLPISASRLAVVLMALGMVPLFALGALVAGAAWLLSGASSAITILGGYTFTLAPVALCISFAVWRGGGLLSSAFLLPILIGAFVLSSRGIPAPLSASIVVVCVVSGFLFTRGALNRSRHAYLSRSAEGNPWGAVAWEATR